MSSIVVAGDTSGSITLSAPAVAGASVLTLPVATDTLIGKATTDVLTNKTLGTGLVAGASLLTSGTAVASTSGTSIDFTSIPSWVKRITVMFNAVSLSGTASFLVQPGTGGTPTTSGYASVTTYNTGAAVGVLTSTAGFIVQAGAVNYQVHGTLVLSNFSGNLWLAEGTLGQNITTAFTINASGYATLSGTLNMVRITTTNGTDTFDAGSINIMYE